MKLKSLFLGLLATVFFLVGCDDRDPIIPNEEELITTIIYTLSSPGESAIVLKWQDLDGDGGDAPDITTGTILATNKTYTGSLILLNEQKTPAENITKEIKEEDEEHQFFFETTVSGLTIEYNDKDDDGKPIGLATEVSTPQSAGTGKLTITLLHEPDKDAAGVAGGDPSNAGGETDIDVEFEIEVK